MSSLGDLVLTNIGDKEVVEPPSKDVFVNRTILYQPVSQQDPMLFVGSDDRWIYAVELTTGAVRWKVPYSYKFSRAQIFAHSGCAKSEKFRADKYMNKVLEICSFIYRKTWTKYGYEIFQRY